MSRRSLNGLNLNSQRINKLGAPAVSDDAATKNYVDTLLALKQIATTGDLSAAPVPSVTFSGLGNLVDLFFDFVNVGHDYTTAAQTFSAQYSVDGTNFGNAAVFTPSISSGALNTGQCRIFGNGSLRPHLVCGLTTGNANNPPNLALSTDRTLILFAGAPIVAVRFVPTTSGNLNKGSITLSARGVLS